MTGFLALVLVVSACGAAALGGHLLAGRHIRQGRCWCGFYCEHQRAADARRRAREGA